MQDFNSRRQPRAPLPITAPRITETSDALSAASVRGDIRLDTIQKDLNEIATLLKTPGEVGKQNAKTVDLTTRLIHYTIADERMNTVCDTVLENLIKQPDHAGLAVLHQVQERLNKPTLPGQSGLTDFLLQSGLFAINKAEIEEREANMLRHLDEIIEIEDARVRADYNVNIGTVIQKTMTTLTDDPIRQKITPHAARQKLNDWLAQPA